MYDVAIIGAGVVGGMTARALSKYKLRIVLLEKQNDVAMGATKANSAIVHAGFDAKEGSLKAKLNVEGSRMMKTVCEELGVKYINNGALVVGFDEDDRRMIEQLLIRGKRNGVEGLRILEQAELRAHEPHLTETATCALYAPTGAIISPYELAIAAIGNAMDNGAELRRNFDVCRIDEEEDGYLIASRNEQVKARFVVNCAGMFSDVIAKLVGDDSFDVHPRKGEYLLLDSGCGAMTTHTIFRTPSAMGKGILISPTVDGNLLLGPTSVDIQDKENTATAASGLADVIAKTKEMLPAAPLEKTITSFCGLRAVGDTGDFIIDSPRDRFINAAGIESPGLSAAPAIATYIVQMMQEQGLKTEADPQYDPIRPSAHAFREASLREKNTIIKEQPAYGKIVCRCEGVTEGEILDAIRRHPQAVDMDGVKRRTRAQMGRCQGGFCAPYIMELLAKEHDIPFEAVTKSGGASYLTVGKTKE